MTLQRTIAATFFRARLKHESFAVEECMDHTKWRIGHQIVRSLSVHFSLDLVILATLTVITFSSTISIASL